MLLNCQFEPIWTINRRLSMLFASRNISLRLIALENSPLASSNHLSASVLSLLSCSSVLTLTSSIGFFALASPPASLRNACRKYLSLSALDGNLLWFAIGGSVTWVYIKYFREK